MLLVPNLDTLRLCSVLNSASFGALFLFMWLGRRAERYLLYWAGSAFLYGAVLIGFNVALPRLALSTLLAMLLAFSNVLPTMGLRSFEGRPVWQRWMALPMLFIGGCHLIPHLLAHSADGAVAGVMDSLGLAGAMAISGVMLARGPTRGQRLAGGAMLAYLPAYGLGLIVDLHGSPGSRTLALVPMVADQVLLGILNFGLIAIPFDHARQKLEETALRDPLTGVLNRAGLDVEMGRLLGEGAGLIAIDVDHFKRINDSFGHKAGDEVLVIIAQEARRLARAQGGVLARLGGDEFVMVLPAGGAGPATVGTMLKQRLRPMQDDVLAWSLSMGIAVLEAKDDFATGLARADQALYRAKAGGRNRLAA